MLNTISDFISKVTRGEKIRIGDTEAQWKKVSELTPGMMIAVPNEEALRHLGGDRQAQARHDSREVEGTDVAWDEIVSIRRLPPEKVYDIEVEGTHNFVAGHLLDIPLPKTSRILTDEPLRGPPRKNKLEIGNWKLEIPRKWYGSFFAHNTYISTNVGIGSPGNSSLASAPIYLEGATGNINTYFGGFGKYQNILTYSEAFDDANWTASNVAVTANNATAPDGTSTADTLADSLAGGSVSQTTGTAPSNNNFTFSVWLKTSAGTQAVDLRIDGATTGTGTKATVTATTSWQRFSVTQNPNGFTGNITALIFPGGTAGTGTVIAWGAQLEQASTMQVYAATSASAVGSSTSSGLVARGTGPDQFSFGGSGNALLSIGDTANTSEVSIRASGGSINSILDLQSSTGTIKFGDGSNQYNLNIYNGNTLSTQLIADGTSYINQTSGNLGIGTTGPAAKLDVKGSFKVSGGTDITLQTSSGDVSINPGSTNVNFNSNNITNLAQISGDLKVTGKIYPGLTASGGGQSTNFIVADNDNNQILTNAASGWGTGGTDFAEVFSTDGTLSAGDLVELAGGSTLSQNSPLVGRSNLPYSSIMIGVITDRPGFVGGRNPNDNSNLTGKIVGLLGRVPVKISTVNGPVKLGDPLTSSIIPGIAMKATQSGPIIARALENQSDESIPMSNSQCPAAEQNLRDPAGNPVTCGKILSFVQNSWFDPDALLTSAGQLKISQISTPSGQTQFSLQDAAGNFIDKLGSFSDAAIANLKSGYISAQKIVGDNLSILGNVNVGGKLVSPVIDTTDLVATGTAKLKKIETEIISPLGNSSDIIVSLKRSDLAWRGPTSTKSGSFGRLLIKGENDQTVASIDSSGSATFSGELSASSILSDVGNLSNLNVSADTTISGTLYAGKIVSGDINDLKSSFGNLLDKVNNLATVSGSLQPTTSNLQPTSSPTLAPLSASTPTLTMTPTPTVLPTDTPSPTPTIDMNNQLSTQSALPSSTDSASLLARLVEFLSSADSLNNKVENFIATSSATIAQISPTNTSLNLTDNINLPNSQLNTLNVIGSSSLADTTIAGQLMVDGRLLLENNKLASLDDTLYLSALDMVDIMGGQLTVDKTGNLTVTGTLLARGGIITNEIRPLNGDLTIDLSNAQKTPLGWQAESHDSPGVEELQTRIGGFGQLLIMGNNDKPVASVDAAGNATFSGILTASKLNFTSDSPIASSSGSLILTAADNFLQNGINAPGIKTSGSAGSATLLAGNNELIIFNPNITDHTLIYITPTSPTQNRTLFAADKKPSSYFAVAIDTPIPYDIKFNWWIVN